MRLFELDPAYWAQMAETIRGDVGFARYRAADEWHRADVQWTRILPDGLLETAFLIDHSVTGDIVVTGVELFSRSGVRIGGIDTHIERTGSEEGILFIVRMQIVSLYDESESILGMTVLA